MKIKCELLCHRKTLCILRAWDRHRLHYLRISEAWQRSMRPHHEVSPPRCHTSLSGLFPVRQYHYVKERELRRFSPTPLGEPLLFAY